MPYEPHPIFHFESEHQDIWRYVTFAKLVWIIQKSKLHFHRCGAFDDPYEGAVPRGVIELRRRGLERNLEEGGSDATVEDLNPDFEGQLTQERVFAETIAYANCWYTKDVESAAMWELYRTRGKPIAIKSTVKGLIDAVEPIGEDIRIGEVIYMNHDASFAELSTEDQEKLVELYTRTENGNLLYPVLSKRSEFEHESEIRAIYMNTSPLSDLANKDDIHLANMSEVARPFFNLTVDVDKLIDEIVIGPQTDNWVVDAIQCLICKSDLNIDADDVRASDLDKNPFEF